RLPKEKLNKEVHVVSNNTLVENPAVEKYLKLQLKKIEKAGKENLFQHNPNLFTVKQTNPALDDTFWVNLIGNGYPAPNKWFRWCTQRMKINPTVDYIKETTSFEQGAIIILGTRQAESNDRSNSMKKYDTG